MDTWFSNFLIEQLRTETETDSRKTKNLISGTKQDPNGKLPYLFQPKIIEWNFSKNFKDELLTNDFFVFDMENTDIDDLSYFLDLIEAETFEETKHIILVSNFKSWSATQLKYKFIEEYSNLTVYL